MTMNSCCSRGTFLFMSTVCENVSNPLSSTQRIRKAVPMVVGSKWELRNPLQAILKNVCNSMVLNYPQKSNFIHFLRENPSVLPFLKVVRNPGLTLCYPPPPLKTVYLSAFIRTFKHDHNVHGCQDDLIVHVPSDDLVYEQNIQKLIRHLHLQ